MALRTTERFKLESMSGVHPVTRWATFVSTDASKSSRVMLETSVDKVLDPPNLDRNTTVHWNSSAWAIGADVTTFRRTAISPSIPDPSPSKANW